MKWQENSYILATQIRFRRKVLMRVSNDKFLISGPYPSRISFGEFYSVFWAFA